MTQLIAVYGKGGIGKSVVATSLSACYAMRDMKVLHIGCDPKVDSAIRLVNSRDELRTVLDVLGDKQTQVAAQSVIAVGRLGIHCCESGGPPPGLGCGGRGVARTLEFLEDMEVIEEGEYDVVIFDVLGDVVCGGFAAPLRQGFGDKVVIVLSEEPMAVYAANNISRAVRAYEDNGIALAGLVGNLKESSQENMNALERFAGRLSSQMLGFIPRDGAVIAAERRRRTVVEYAPDSPASVAFNELADKLLAIDKATLDAPSPLGEDEFYEFLESW